MTDENDTDTEDMQPGYEKATRSALSRFADIVENNAKLALVLVFITAVLQWTGFINLGLPAWWPIALIVIAIAGLAAYFGGQAIDDEIPEEDKILIIDQGSESVWKVTKDRFAELDAVGELNQWDGKMRAYGVKSYDPVDDTLQGNWRGVPPHAEWRAKETVDDVEDLLESTRGRLGKQADMAKKIRMVLPDIAQSMDTKRTHAIESRVEEATVDNALDEGETVADILEEVVDDDINPFTPSGDHTRKNGDSPDPDAGEGEEDDTATIEIDQEAVEDLGGMR